MEHVPSMTATQAVFLLLSGLLFWISYLAGQVMFKRESEQDLNLVAQELGLQHTPDGHAALLKSLKGYRLVAGNRFFIRVRKLWRGKYGRISASFFDLSFIKIGPHKHNFFELNTELVVRATLNTPKLPTFLLLPKKVFQTSDYKGIGSRVAFPNYPAFEEQFSVYGTDVDGIRKLFSGAVRSFCESRSSLTMQGRGDTLLMYELFAFDFNVLDQKVAIIRACLDVAVVIDTAC